MLSRAEESVSLTGSRLFCLRDHLLVNLDPWRYAGRIGIVQ